MSVNIFELEPDAHVKVYSQFGYTKEKADEDVKTVMDWLETQTQLPEKMDERSVRNFLILNKFKIDMAKKGIVKYYTIRHSIPDWFSDTHPNSPSIQKALEHCKIVVLPKTKDGLYRIHFIKLLTPGKVTPYEMSKTFFNVLEMRLKEDYLAGDILVGDFTNFTFNDYFKFSPMFLLNCIKIYQNVYALRFQAIHLFNAAPILSTILAFAKAILKPKVFKRIHIYSDDACLKDIFSDEDLPKDYGGKGPSLYELSGMLQEKFAEHKNRFDKLETFKKSKK